MRQTFAPLAHPVFRFLWLASIASNLGFWMHGVGAAWLMTSLTTSAAVVALLQTASAVPTFLLALPAGALTDVVDRRRILLAAQLFMAAVAAALGLVVVSGHASIPVVLGLTFALGIGGALNQPAWSAIMPELVPREELAQALVLNGMAFTVAQAVGPALGGALVAAAGPEAVFLLNAVSYLGQIAVIWRWRRERRDDALPAEHVAGAVRAGVRYLRFAPELQVVLVRAGAYVVCLAALAALLPIVARRELGLGASGYGALVGAMGIGAVIGALAMPRVRARLSIDGLVVAGSLGMAGALACLAVVREQAVLAGALAVGGFCQMAVMSSLGFAAQSALPQWVRGRGLAMYTLVFQLAFAVGAAAFGALAAATSIATALVAAAAVLVASVTLARPFPLRQSAARDVTPVHWPELHLDCMPAPDDGPVLVTAEYRIARADIEAFTDAITALGRARRRDGAVRWTCWFDLDDPTRHVEAYVVASFGEHLRQRARSTEADRAVWERVRAFHRGDDPQGVAVRWHLARRHDRRHGVVGLGRVSAPRD